MKKHLFLLVLFAFFISCSQDTNVSVPDTVLPKEKMAEVMVDVHLLEATLNINTYSRDKATTGKIAPTSDVLKKNKITKKQYDESFDFYSKHPKLLSEVYQQVLNNLSKMQAQVMNEK